MNALELLPDEIRASLPLYGGQEDVSDPIVHVKYFTPDANWTWYATEGFQEGEDFIFFGYVVGHESEWGTFSLAELKTLRGPWGLAVERDLHFTPKPISEIQRGIASP